MFNNYQQAVPNFGGNFYNPQPQRQPKLTQPLKQEDIKKLRNNGDAFSLKVTDIDLLKSYCTHKNNGAIVLQQTADGKVFCPICGETFNLVDASEEAVQGIVSDINDVMQTVKTYYVDMPEQTIMHYFQMMPLINKLPKLYELALKNFNEYEMGAPINGMNNTNAFAMLNNLMTPGMGMGYNPAMGMQQGMAQNMNMGMGMNMGMQPGMNPAMGMNMNMGMPQQNMVFNNQPVQGNGFGYMGAPMPQQQQEQPSNNMNQQAAQPKTSEGNVTVEKNFNV